MAEPRLSVRSAKARDLARRLARRESRSIVDVVERALESYAIREAALEPASTFYASLTASNDIDLEKVIRENRQVRSGVEL
ncbi:type II toxin-antitoxin system VapB family antitoxin [Mesorhizobium loti]|uniref:type II toxin-antitoxin system VapB family antitoxin n=1 Tax=Rhizobium loti TaxID=381 RepID=UPI00047CC3E4|nr:type II toxin-antitoxin system VapB family antitoxin [Mesorhizobium loti]